MHSVLSAHWKRIVLRPEYLPSYKFLLYQVFFIFLYILLAASKNLRFGTQIKILIEILDFEQKDTPEAVSLFDVHASLCICMQLFGFLESMDSYLLALKNITKIKINK